MKRQILFLLSLIVVVALLVCTAREDTFEMEKLELRQQLDGMLLNIDQQIENVVRDTARLEPGEYEEQLVQYKHRLEALRDTVLIKIERVEDVSRQQWPEFSEDVDSTTVNIRRVLESIRDEIDTLTQRYTLPS